MYKKNIINKLLYSTAVKFKTQVPYKSDLCPISRNNDLTDSYPPTTKLSISRHIEGIV